MLRPCQKSGHVRLTSHSAAFVAVITSSHNCVLAFQIGEPGLGQHAFEFLPAQCPVHDRVLWSRGSRRPCP